MGKGRARARARQRGYIEKAAPPQGIMGQALARANTSAQPRTFGLADALGLAVAGQRPLGTGMYDMDPMLRDPRDLVPFGPSNPLAPAPIDPRRPDTGRPEPRVTEYPVSFNLPDGSRPVMPWSVLRDASNTVDIIRRCIEIRKEQLDELDWAIGVDEKVVESLYASRTTDSRADIAEEMRQKFLPEIERVTEFWANPWRNNRMNYRQWVRALMEERLVLDATAIYPRTTYGGDILDFEIIDGTTIKPLISFRGTQPEAPYPAFQQVLYGFPRGEFTAPASYELDKATGQLVETVQPGMLADQMYYYVHNTRTWTPYGYSETEQALLSASIYLKRRGWMISEYDDGSTPLMWLVPSATDQALVSKMSATNRREWEATINAEMVGNTGARHRVKVTPPGFAPIAMPSVDERYKPDYDQFLIKILCMPFGVTSTGLGFSESKGLGNSGLHEGQEKVQDGATVGPDKKMISAIVNELMHRWQKVPKELTHTYVEVDAEDTVAQDGIRNAQRARGAITLNEDRRAGGLAPANFPEADMLMVQAGPAGWMPLEGLAERLEQQQANEQALVDSQAAANADAVDGEEVSEEDASKALELAEYRRWRRRRGDREPSRPFLCKSLEPGDFAGDVPPDVDFEAWAWVPEEYDSPEAMADDMIVKGDGWRHQLRDRRGRWMKLGTHGPALPGKDVLHGLAEQAKAGRAARAAREAKQSAGRAQQSSSTLGGMTSPKASKKLADLRDKREQAEARHEGAKRESARLERASRDAGGDDLAANARRDAAIAEERRLGIIAHDARRAELAAAERDAAPTDPVAAARAELKAAEDAHAKTWGKGPKAASDAAYQVSLAQQRLDAAERKAKRATPPAAADVDAVKDLVDNLAEVRGDRWNSLSDVRAELDQMGIPRDRQDAALRELVRNPEHGMRLIPAADQGKRTQAERDAALRVGMSDYVMIKRMNEDERRSLAGGPAKASEAVPAASEPKLSKKQRDMAARFDKLAGEHAADPEVARWRQRAIDLTGESESGADVRDQMNSVQNAFTHDLKGAQAAKIAREAGGDERAQKIARGKAARESRAAYYDSEISRLKTEQSFTVKGSQRYESLKTSIRYATQQRDRQRSQIDSIERDVDTKLHYDESGRLTHTTYEPPAPKAPRTADRSAADPFSSTSMDPLASAAQAADHGHGRVAGHQVKAGTRLMYRDQHVVEALENPRRAAKDSQGREGVVFRVRREDGVGEGTMRINHGDTVALAAPKASKVPQQRAAAPKPAAPAESSLPRGWKALSTTQARKARAADIAAASRAHEAHFGIEQPAGYHEQAGADIAARELPDDAKVYAMGEHHVIVRSDAVTPQARDLAMRELADLTAKYPLSAPVRLELGGREGGAASSGGLGRAQEVYVSAEHARATAHSGGFETWFMASAARRPAVAYTTSHEYGHALARDRGHLGIDRDFYESQREHLSAYGKHDLNEAYAEAFAEWHATGGKSANPAVRAYAERYDWAGVPQQRAAAPKPAAPARTPAASVKPKQMEADWKAHNDSLSPQQRKAVKDYTTIDYFELNKHLKGQSTKSAKERKAMDAQAALISGAMAPAPRAAKLHRGTHTSSLGLPEKPTVEQMRALVGKSLVNDAFTSTSASKGEIFAGNLELEIDMPEGTPSLWLNGNSRVPSEHEVLLDRGARMQVVAVTESPKGSGNYKMKVRIG